MAISAIAQSSADHEIRRARTPARRWLQFRLGTLLLVPLLLVLLQRFARDDAGGLMLVSVSFGAIFGSLWALGRMRIVGLANSGLRRLLPVLWAALCGGLTAGMLAGPLGLWTALLRESVAWMYSFTGGGARFEFWHAVYELATAGLFGSLIGAFFGAWGALIAGPAWAYLAFARQWTRGPTMATSDRDELASADRSGELGQPARRRPGIARKLVITFYLVGLLGFPTLLLWNAIWQARDRTYVRRCARGWNESAPGWDSKEPNWSHKFLPYRVRRQFGRIDSIALVGPINDEALKSLAETDRLQSIAFQLEPTDAELTRLAAELGRLQQAGKPELWLYLAGDKFSADGILALARSCVCNFEIADPSRGEEIVEKLCKNAGPGTIRINRIIVGQEFQVSIYLGTAGIHYRWKFVPPLVSGPSLLPLW